MEKFCLWRPGGSFTAALGADACCLIAKGSISVVEKRLLGLTIIFSFFFPLVALRRAEFS